MRKLKKETNKLIVFKEEGFIPIKSWCLNLEDKTLEQAKNLARLPFAFHHIALMPDAHLGYGMPIGGVLATKDVIVPNAVGVDIGCFVGETKIPLLNGSQKKLIDLFKKGDEFWVYSLDENFNFVPGKAKAVKTRENVDLLKIVISGGEEIICTPDQQFMMLNGSYKEAKDLKRFDGLMSLYRSYESRDGYEFLKNFIKQGIHTHRMVVYYLMGKIDKPIHHVDGNWYNNDPSNLEYIEKSEHSSHHAKLKIGRLKSKEFKENRIRKLKENGFYNKEKYGELKKELGTKNIIKYMKENYNDFKNKIKDNGKRGAKFLRDFNLVNNITEYICKFCGRKILGKGGFKRHLNWHEKNNLENHKVLFVEELLYKEDVYCLQVEKFNNFAISAGVFVHNCGITAIKSTSKEVDKDTLKKIIEKIIEVIPTGFKHQEKSQDKSLLPYIDRTIPICLQEYESALHQLGTLGGGNHFIELQKDENDNIWIMLHSGSRNLGKKVADYYNKLAIEENKKWFSTIPKEWQLAFFPVGSEGFYLYQSEMIYCIEFAVANRKLMLERICGIFSDIIKCDFDEPIDVIHNYARLESHFGENVYVHRKGATSAKKGGIGIIPGSQGTSSYIVKGLGNRDSYTSCSHGAGRKMGRNDAKKSLNLEEEIKKLDDKGIIHSIKDIKDLDEASGAYKSIDEVMEEQKDLVEIMIKLEPLGVIKG